MKQTTKLPKTKKTDNVLFPITSAEFEALCSRIITEFDLPDDAKTRTEIATCILHAPSNVGAAPISHIGSFARKALSNHCCFAEIDKHRATIKEAAEKEKQAETNKGTADSERVSN